MTEKEPVGLDRRGSIIDYLNRIGEAFFRLTGISMGISARHIRLERVAVAIADLPPHLEGFTIGVLSDLHMGPFISVDFVREAAARLAAEHPDLIVVAGDLVSDAAAVPLVAKALEPLSRPIYAVAGNWDHHTGTAGISRAVHWLNKGGIEAAPGLWLAGIDDRLRDGDIEQALAGAPVGAIRILLAHRPDHADRALPDHHISLQISGHSHGGQIRIPGLPPLLLPRGGRKYVAGLAQAPATQVYTSRGLGVVHLPIRLNCPPEITLLQLEPDQG